jgi:hypothetical protein
VIRRRLLESVVEAHHVGCRRGLEDWEQCYRFLDDAVHLGTKSVGRTVVPNLKDRSVDVDDSVVTRDYVNAVLPHVRQDNGGQWIDAIVHAAVVPDRGMGRDIRAVGPEFPCTTIPIAIPGRVNGALGRAWCDGKGWWSESRRVTMEVGRWNVECRRPPRKVERTVTRSVGQCSVSIWGCYLGSW